MGFVANLLFFGEMQGLWLWPVAGQGRAARQELRGRERQAAVLTAGPAGLRGGWLRSRLVQEQKNLSLITHCEIRLHCDARHSKAGATFAGPRGIGRYRE